MVKETTDSVKNTRLVELDFVRGVAVMGWVVYVLVVQALDRDGFWLRFFAGSDQVFTAMFAVVFGYAAAHAFFKGVAFLVYLRRLFCLIIFFTAFGFVFADGVGLGLSLWGTLAVFLRNRSVQIIRRTMNGLLVMQLLASLINGLVVNHPIPLLQAFAQPTPFLITLGYWIFVSGRGERLRSTPIFVERQTYLFAGLAMLLTVLTQNLTQLTGLLGSWSPAVLGLCLAYIALWVRQQFDGALSVYAVSALGRMSLSSGLLMSVGVRLIVLMHGSPLILLLGGSLVVLVTSIWCQWWLSRFRFGPCEWLVRSVACGVLVPIRAPIPTN